MNAVQYLLLMVDLDPAPKPVPEATVTRKQVVSAQLESANRSVVSVRAGKASSSPRKRRPD